jgi:hypothetical protein
MRQIILHYHLFKNAGTSLDAAFKENFSEESGEWVTKEFPNANPVTNLAEVTRWIIANPQAKCFSSHTAMLPPPQIDGIEIFPVIFIRHPIDRTHSAYNFEKNQGAKSFGSTLARNTTFAGYVETSFSIPSYRQFRNFHTLRLAHMFDEKYGNELKRAKMAAIQLPFIGIVEEFDKSLLRLETALKAKGFTDISLKPTEKNVTRSVTKSLDEKLDEIKNKLGDRIYTLLENENVNDIEVYNLAKEMNQ